MKDIRLLKRNEIDQLKWDDCIATSSDSLPYAFTWYLDSVAENWDALVIGDYKIVMPLVWLRKFGIKCLYQPYYCQQLGVFGKDITKQVLQLFLDQATKKFSYININLYPSAHVVAEEYHLLPKKNLLLCLEEEYSQLKKRYSENHRRNIKKAETTQIVFSDKTELKQFQNFYLENINRREENFKSKHEKIFNQLTKTIAENKTGHVFSAIDKAGNLLAASMLIQHQTRLINIINTSSAKGKNTGASHFLFDNIIKNFAGNEITLDFEGSSIASIARFYQGFGAVVEVFYNYHTTIIEKQKQRFL